MKKPIRFGKYLLLERINVGGMAEVFKAKAFGAEGFQRIFAIKRILPNMSEDQEFINMFVDEARMAVQLNHANIIQIYELDKHDNQYYIAMEYVAGKDLRRIVDWYRKRKLAMPVPLAAYICAKICEGLDYAHRKTYPDGKPMQLVHRDISPQNMLVSFEGDVKIIDFGIAKAADRLSKTQAGVLKGKFGYMSPEQVAGQEIDHRSDLFAVGVLLYEMLTCTRLFVAETDFSTLEKVRQCEIPPMRQLNENVPDELEAVVRKALAKNLDERYQWCSDFNEDLQRFLITDQSIFNSKRMAAFMQETFREDIEQEMIKMQEFLRIQADDLGTDDWGNDDGASQTKASNERTEIFEVGDDSPLASAKTRVGDLDAFEGTNNSAPRSGKRSSGTKRVDSNAKATLAFGDDVKEQVQNATRSSRTRPNVVPKEKPEVRDNTKFILGGAIGFAMLIIGAAVWFTQSRKPDDGLTTVKVELTPSIVRAELYLDQKEVAHGITPFAPLRLPKGKHEIHLVSKDSDTAYDDITTMVEFVPGKTNVLPLKLSPKAAVPVPVPASQPIAPPPPPPPQAKKGSLDILSEPPGAVVLLNGTKLGLTPKHVDNLAIGSRLHIELRHPGYKPFNEDAEVHGDDRFDRHLERVGSGSSGGGSGSSGGRSPATGSSGGGHNVIEVKGLGFMVVNTPGNPDTKVIVDGHDTTKKTPILPSSPLNLAPGTHAVMLVFTDGTKKSFQVNIAVGETYKLIERK